MEGVRVCPHTGRATLLRAGRKRNFGFRNPHQKSKPRQNKGSRSRGIRRWGYCCVCTVGFKGTLSSCEQTGPNKDRKNS